MSKQTSTISSFSVIVIFACLGIIGMALIPLLSIPLYPSTIRENLTVTYFWPDASARIMEQEVTAKLEGLFAAIKGIQDINSVSSKGYGRLDLMFKKDVNRDAIRFEIAGVIRQCYQELPVDVSYPELSLTSTGESITPLMTYSLNSAADSYHIKKYAKKEVIPLLSRIKGVNEVRLYGAVPYEMTVEFQMGRLQALGITGDDIANAINTYFKMDLIGKGSYRQPGQQYIIQLPLQLTYNAADSAAWEDILVKNIDGHLVRLKDLAKVRYEEQTPTSYYRVSGLNAVNMVIYPENGVDNIAVAKSVREEARRLRHNLQPGYSILLASDSTEYLTQEINKIIFRAALSLVILLVFILVFSRQFRYLLLILITLATNLLITVIFLYFLKVELHLYSLVGLTISLGLVVDNSIVIIHHIRNRGNKSVLLPIFAATLTTIAALGVIFFLQQQQRLNLLDFARVIIINLSVSLVIALFFVPALMDEIRPTQPKKSRRYHRNRRAIVKLTGAYEKCIVTGRKHRWVGIAVLLLTFGIPVHLLPDKMEGDDWRSNIYNKSLGSTWFREDIKPTIEKIVGGSMRLFMVNVFENSYYPEPGETLLHVRGTMPEGCTVQQMNEGIEQMENFISQFEEVELFQTSVSSYRDSHIVIHFKPKDQWSSFPFMLKSRLESEAINLGGADWSVYGVGLGFSNAISDGYRDQRIELEGYNYDQLYQYAELLRTRLLENPRIRKVDIAGSALGDRSLLHEFFIAFNDMQLALNEVSASDFYKGLKENSYRREIRPIYARGELRRVFLTSDTYESFNDWDFSHSPLATGEKSLKLGRFGSIEKRKTGNDIYKSNQQYHLVVAYDFIGSYRLAEMVRNKQVDELANILPLGYSVQASQFLGWNRDEQTQYYLVLLVFVVIYFICAILLESLLQPLAIIAMIPISFIGAFLTFYLFDLNYDQGGFAAFILLSGLSVNAALYIVNDYNNFRIAGRRKRVKAYLKAFNHKIIPIILTVVSTVSGLIPFVMQGQQDVFWFAFAAGTIGGMVFSLVGIVVYLPLFLPLLDKSVYKPHISTIQ